ACAGPSCNSGIKLWRQSCGPPHRHEPTDRAAILLIPDLNHVGSRLAGKDTRFSGYRTRLFHPPPSRMASRVQLMVGRVEVHGKTATKMSMPVSSRAPRAARRKRKTFKISERRELAARQTRLARSAPSTWGST